MKAQIISLNLDIVSLNAAHTEAGAAADAAPADSATAANRELLRQARAPCILNLRMFYLCIFNIGNLCISTPDGCIAHAVHMCS